MDYVDLRQLYIFISLIYTSYILHFLTTNFLFLTVLLRTLLELIFAGINIRGK